MLRIRLDNVGKLFNRKWVFRGLSDEFTSDHNIAVLGSNGSGKSTLLRMLSGNLTPSQGEIIFELDGQEIAIEKIFNEVSMAAPYLELIQDYSLEEHIKFHFQFKKLSHGVIASQIPELLNLSGDKTKPIKQFSSGMIQRVKLGLAILSDTSLVLLDEPSSNLDSEGINWYNELLTQFAKGRTVIICSNRREEEYQYCNRELIMENYK